MIRFILGIIFFWTWVLPDPCRAEAIQYNRTRKFDMDQNPAVREIAGPGDLRPVSSRTLDLFSYTYDLTAETLLKDLPVILSYQDGRHGVNLGRGWQLCLNAVFDRSYTLDLLEPRMGVQLPQGKETCTLFLGTLGLDAGQVQEGYAAGPDNKGWIWVFRPIPDMDPFQILPDRIIRPGSSEIKFNYGSICSKTRLISISTREASLSLKWNMEGQDSTFVEGIELFQDSRPPISWKFDYCRMENHRFLTRIQTTGAEHIPRVLSFSYTALEKDPATPDSMNLANVWQKIQDDPRFILPQPPGHAKRLNIGTHPGVRLMHIDLDAHIDVMVAQKDMELRSWRWDTESHAWQDISGRFRACRPIVGSKFPTGALFNSLAMKFANAQHLNTTGFLSFIISNYKPSADHSGLSYESSICFPLVKWGKFNPENGRTWRCDYQNNTLLKLPVPLQYEGEAPWPEPTPELHSVERITNQGAQIMDISGEGYQAILYSGLQYRDAATGQDMMNEKAWHRNTKNCAFRYRTLWESRMVDVYLCQGVWQARDTHFSDNYGEQPNGHLPFWERMDLRHNLPGLQFILPFPEDPEYGYHLEGFRNVRFARFTEPGEDYSLFAVINATGLDSPALELRHPPARDVYGFLPGLNKWEKLPITSEFIPPTLFLDSYKKGRIADLDGKFGDDLIIATGNMRKTFMNTGRIPRWSESIPYRLPDDCDLGRGDCQMIDIDRDGDLDLFIGTGNRIYLNTGRPGSELYMQVFTDEGGNNKHVDMIPLFR